MKGTTPAVCCCFKQLAFPSRPFSSATFVVSSPGSTTFPAIAVLVFAIPPHPLFLHCSSYSQFPPPPPSPKTTLMTTHGSDEGHRLDREAASANLLSIKQSKLIRSEKNNFYCLSHKSQYGQTCQSIFSALTFYSITQLQKPNHDSEYRQIIPWLRCDSM